MAIAILRLIPERKTNHMLIVRHNGSLSNEDIKKAIEGTGKIVTVKSVNTTSTGTNTAFEVKVTDGDAMVNALRALSGIDTVSLVKHDGEFRG